MPLTQRRHIPTKLYANQLMSDTCSSSSSSSSSSGHSDSGFLDSLKVHADPNHRVIIIRHRPKYYKTKVNTTSLGQFDINMVPIWVFLGSMAGVLVLAIMFLFAWRAHRRRLSKIASKRLHLDGADKPVLEAEYKPVDKEDGLGQFNAA